MIVTFGKLGGDTAATTVFDVDSQTNIMKSATITIDPAKVNYDIDPAHEGTHIEDEMTGILSITAHDFGFPDLPQLTGFQTEYRGYQTSARYFNREAKLYPAQHNFRMSSSWR